MMEYNQPTRKNSFLRIFGQLFKFGRKRSSIKRVVPGTRMAPSSRMTANEPVSRNCSKDDPASGSGADGSNNVPAKMPSSPIAVALPIKRTANDFIFGKIIGEGSFSTVYVAKDIHSQQEFAIKVCEKMHIIREKKTQYVKRERDILYSLCHTPFIVKLFYTFQDSERLYFVLSYAKNGELLSYINKYGSFDLPSAKFYAAELVLAMEYMHKAGVAHRDLKPDNILLDDNMHILITDFGSAKSIKEDEEEILRVMALEEAAEGMEGKSAVEKIAAESPPPRRKRRNSFVGTAQYVSPELLTGDYVSTPCDLWAYGCIVYQMISGSLPFRARSEYMIFQKITKLNYDFPVGFDETAKDLINKLLVLDPDTRLGSGECNDKHKYASIRNHPFFQGIEFDTLPVTYPPPIHPHLPEIRNHYRVPDHLEPGLDDKQLTRLLGLNLNMAGLSIPSLPTQRTRKRSGVLDYTPEEMEEELRKQSTSKWHPLVHGSLILKQGLVDKRKGLFSRRRMLLLTMGPHLYYADPSTNVIKGEIPWSADLRAEPKTFKIFFVHTPNRVYYLEDPEGYALEWCKAIEEVRAATFDNNH